MKKWLLTLTVLSGFAFLSSCDKGDDNPYGNWKCTCIVSRLVYLHATDTVKSPKLDTVYLNANEMDRNSAMTFCNQAKKSYTDTLGGTANCIFK